MNASSAGSPKTEDPAQVEACRCSIHFGAIAGPCYIHSMALPGVRPRFKFESPLAGTEITQRISDRLQEENPQGLRLKYAHYHLTLSFMQRAAAAVSRW